MASVDPINTPLWTQCQQNLVEGSTTSFKSFQIKKNASGYLLTIFEIFSQKVLNELAENINSRLKKLPSTPLWEYQIPYQKYLAEVSEDLLTTYKNPNEENEFIQTVKLKYGIGIPEQKEGFDKVLAFTKDFFSRLPQKITQKNVDEIIPTWQRETINEKLTLRTKLSGTKIVQDHITLSAHDKIFLGLSEKDDLEDIQFIDCSRYALMKIREVQVIGSMRFNGIHLRICNKSDPMKYFVAWGYDIVEPKNVKKGDLVVYLNKNDDKGFFITHLGIMTETGLIESKMGIHETAISHHKLEDIPAQFGNQVVFFRKKILNPIDTPIWKACKQNLTSGKTTSFKSFKIIKNETGYLGTLFTTFVDKIFLPLTSVVNILKESPEELSKHLPIPYEKCLESVSEDFINALDPDDPTHNQVLITKEKYGLEISQQKQGIEKILAYIREIFSQLPQRFTKDNINTVVTTWKTTFARSKLRLRFKLCETKIVKEHVELTSSDRQFLGLTKEDHFKNGELMDCACYAFLKIREAQAIDWIKSTGHAPKDFYETDLMKYLAKWGYGIVKENVRPGDLAVYLNHQDGKNFNIEHIGVMTETGLLESKMGFNETEITHHKLEDIPSTYGDHVAFVRKPSGYR